MGLKHVKFANGNSYKSDELGVAEFTSLITNMLNKETLEDILNDSFGFVGTLDGEIESIYSPSAPMEMVRAGFENEQIKIAEKWYNQMDKSYLRFITAVKKAYDRLIQDCAAVDANANANYSNYI